MPKSCETCSERWRSRCFARECANRKGDIIHGLPVRRSIRLKGFDYRDAGAYFVTICTFRRACVLADVVDDRVPLTAVGSVVESAWRTLPGYFPHVDLDGYVVMPNHLHGILVLHNVHRAKHPLWADALPLLRPRSKGTQPGSVPAVIQTFKAISTRRFHALPGMKLNRLWQRGFYDHVIRDEAELNRIRAYVEENSLRWALDRENLSGPFV